MRPKLASTCSVATKPYRPSEITPAPTHTRPRCSRTPCHTSQAPPISAIAARTNRATDLAISMAESLEAMGEAAWRGNSFYRDRAGCAFDALVAALVAVSYTHLTLPTNRE